MGDKPLSYLDYVKEAFHLRVPLGPLGGVPVNKLLLAGFGILGLANPGFWLLGAAYEAAYLLAIPSNDRFQRVIEGRRLLSSKELEDSERRTFFDVVPKVYGERFRQLEASCRRIWSKAESGKVTAAIDDLKSARLNDLLLVFQKLLLSHYRMEQVLASVKRALLDKDINELQGRIKGLPEESTLRRSLASTLEIQNRRLGNIDRAKENLQIVEAELIRIENQVALLVEESEVGTDPSAFSARLDGMTAALEETNRWMSENSEILSTLDEDTTPSKKAITE